MLLFVDNLTNVDFSFLDPQRGLLGETYLANIKLLGELDEQGMVCDFGTVKKIVRHWLDTELDHRLAVPIHSPNIQKIEIVKRGKVRRSKLYYLRGVIGKKAKLKRRIEKPTPEQKEL